MQKNEMGKKSQDTCDLPKGTSDITFLFQTMSPKNKPR